MYRERNIKMKTYKSRCMYVGGVYSTERLKIILSVKNDRGRNHVPINYNSNGGECVFPNTPPRTLKKTSKDGPQATTIRGVQSSLTSKLVEALSEPFRNPPASFHVIQTCA